MVHHALKRLVLAFMGSFNMVNVKRFLLLAGSLSVAAICQVSSTRVRSFEVASIKPSAPGSGATCGQGGSSVQMTLGPSCSLAAIIRVAYQLYGTENEPLGVPAWTSNAWYAIIAKSASPANPFEQSAMLQPLLADRFKLKWHREKRELPVFYLSMLKGGVKLPATIAGSCVPLDPKAPRLGPPPSNDKPPVCDHLSMRGESGGSWRMDGVGLTTLEQLLPTLEHILGRPVLDTTRLKGPFDFHLKFVWDRSRGTPDENTGAASDISGSTDIAGAIRGLGLKIESGKGPVEVFVVDSVQKPSEN